MNEFTQRQNLLAVVSDIVNNEVNKDNVEILIEQQITFIESGNFLEDISFTSQGDIKYVTFFKQKSDLIKLLEIISDRFKERVWKVLFNKLKEMLPKEKNSFQNPCPSAWKIEHDREVVRNLQKMIKEDILETKKFLAYSLKRANFPEKEIHELISLIPSDTYLSYDATQRMYLSSNTFNRF